MNTPVPTTLPADGFSPPVAPRHEVLPPGSEKTEQLGGHGGVPYTSVSTRGTPLVGFRYVRGSWSGKEVAQRLLPLAEKPATAPVGGAIDVVAKDGYVVGGMVVDSDITNVVAVRVIFVRYKDGHADAQDTYTSDWLGTADDTPPKTLGGHGEIVVGVCGRRGMNQDAIGLVLKPAETPAK